MGRWPAESGLTLVETVLASAILLLLLAGAVQIMARAGADQVHVLRNGDALLRAWTELEQERAGAAAAPAGQLPAAVRSGPATELLNGRVTTTRSPRPGIPWLHDIVVRLEWEDVDGSQRSLSLATAVWQR